MVNNLSVFQTRQMLRLIYADWSSDLLWSQAAAVLLWSDEPCHDLLLRAVRLNIPVIAPVHNPSIRFLEHEGRPGFGYQDSAECMAALLALAPRRGDQRAVDNLADYVAAVLPPEAHLLLAERPSI
jgi:hypothetical protein